LKSLSQFVCRRRVDIIPFRNEVWSPMRAKKLYGFRFGDSVNTPVAHAGGAKIIEVCGVLLNRILKTAYTEDCRASNPT